MGTRIKKTDELQMEEKRDDLSGEEIEIETAANSEKAATTFEGDGGCLIVRVSLPSNWPLVHESPMQFYDPPICSHTHTPYTQIFPLPHIHTHTDMSECVCTSCIELMDLTHILVTRVYKYISYTHTQRYR